jgi:putative peptidoglycan lipid II flippase
MVREDLFLSEKAKMIRAGGVVGIATFLSRIMGYVRDAVMASYFGAGVAAEAFVVAFRIPNLLRRLFAEGSLTVAFIPVYTEVTAKEGREEADRFAGASFRLLALVLFAVTVLGTIGAHWLVRYGMAWNFAADPEKLSLTVSLTRIVFPYIFFIGLVALCMGVLNVRGHFAAPAAAPLLLNVSMILSLVFLASWLSEPVYGLAVGVLIGGLLQLGFQFPFLVRHGVRLWRGRSLWHPAMKKVGALMGPAVLGAAVYQINIVVGTQLAALLPDGSVAYLYYADRLVQFPLGIFGIALATATLPSLSRHAQDMDMDGLKDSFAYAMGLIFFIMLPASVGLIVLGKPIVALLLERGAFDPATTVATTSALFYYALGLTAFAAVRIVVSVFYALQDAKTPMRVAVLSLAANIVFSLALMGPMLHNGLALAISLASSLNLFVLMWLLKHRLGFLAGHVILRSFGRSLFCALVMGAAVALARSLLLGYGPVGFWRLFAGVFGCMIIGGAVYALCARLLKSPEYFSFQALATRRLRRHGNKG